MTFCEITLQTEVDIFRLSYYMEIWNYYPLNSSTVYFGGWIIHQPNPVLGRAQRVGVWPFRLLHFLSGNG